MSHPPPARLWKGLPLRVAASRRLGFLSAMASAPAPIPDISPLKPPDITVSSVSKGTVRNALGAKTPAENKPAPPSILARSDPVRLGIPLGMPGMGGITAGGFMALDAGPDGTGGVIAGGPPAPGICGGRNGLLRARTALLALADLDKPSAKCSSPDSISWRYTSFLSISAACFSVKPLLKQVSTKASTKSALSASIGFIGNVSVIYITRTKLKRKNPVRSIAPDRVSGKPFRLTLRRRWSC